MLRGEDSCGQRNQSWRASGGEAEGFLEREECVDEEDGLSLGAERAEGKVVGFGDKAGTQQPFALNALEERASGGEVVSIRFR